MIQLTYRKLYRINSLETRKILLKTFRETRNHAFYIFVKPAPVRESLLAEAGPKRSNGGGELGVDWRQRIGSERSPAVVNAGKGRAPARSIHVQRFLIRSLRLDEAFADKLGEAHLPHVGEGKALTGFRLGFACLAH